MPIRFRCVYCDKLLGIARRKAAAIVNCPHCGEKLIVPTPDPEDATSAPVDEEKESDEAKALAPAVGNQLFERSDFDAMLQGEPTFRSGDDEPKPPAASAPIPAPPPAKMPRPLIEPLPPIPAPKPQPFPAARNLPQPAPPPPVLSKLPAGFQPEREGIFISSKKLTWLSILSVVLLAAMFGVGYVVARMMKH